MNQVCRKSWRAGSFVVLWLMAAAISAGALRHVHFSQEPGISARGNHLPQAGIERAATGEVLVKDRTFQQDAGLASAAACAGVHGLGHMLRPSRQLSFAAAQARRARGRAPPFFSSPA